LKLRRFLFLWGPVLFQTGLLFYLSSLRMVPTHLRFSDKVAHFVAYGLLALSFLRALHGGFIPLEPVRAFLAIAFTVVYGLTDEFHQSFVPGRDASGWDLLADALGAIVAVVLTGLLLRRTHSDRGGGLREVKAPRRTGDLV
jgi:VanZ family protein